MAAMLTDEAATMRPWTGNTCTLMVIDGFAMLTVERPGRPNLRLAQVLFNDYDSVELLHERADDCLAVTLGARVAGAGWLGWGVPENPHWHGTQWIASLEPTVSTNF